MVNCKIQISCVMALSFSFLDLDMNDIHQTIEWVSEKNPDQHQILISKTPPAINIRHSIYF